MSSSQAEYNRPLVGANLLRALAENWWLLLRGIAAIAFGIWLFSGRGLRC